MSLPVNGFPRGSVPAIVTPWGTCYSFVKGDSVDWADRQKIIQEIAGKYLVSETPGRAVEPDQKQYILDRVLAVWSRNPDMRLMQLILNVYHGGNVDVYRVEDYELAENLETFYEHRGNL